jgi:hypothetical protein
MKTAITSCKYTTLTFIRRTLISRTVCVKALDLIDFMEPDRALRARPHIKTC